MATTIREGAFGGTWDIYESDSRVGTLSEGAFGGTWNLSQNDRLVNTFREDDFSGSWREGTFGGTYDIYDEYGNDYDFF